MIYISFTSLAGRIFYNLMKLKPQKERQFLILEYGYVTWKPAIDGFPLLSYMVIRLRSSALTTESQNYIIIIVF